MKIFDSTFQAFEDKSELIEEGKFAEFLFYIRDNSEGMRIITQALYVLSQTMPDETIQDLIEYSNNKNASLTGLDDYHIELNGDSLEFEVLYDDIIHLADRFLGSTKYFPANCVSTESLLRFDMRSLEKEFNKFSPDYLLKNTIKEFLMSVGLDKDNSDGIKNEWDIDINKINFVNNIRASNAFVHILAVRILASVLMDQFWIYYVEYFKKEGFILSHGKNGNNSGHFSIKLDHFYSLITDGNTDANEALVYLVSDLGAFYNDKYHLYACLYTLGRRCSHYFSTDKYVETIQKIKTNNINDLLREFIGWDCPNLTREEGSKIDKLRG